MKIVIFVLILFFLGIKTSYSWVYPEHRDIALLAIQNLSPEYRSVLDKLWAEARTGYEDRLTEAVIDATQSIEPTQLDFASWPAISGDHSCSPQNLLFNVLKTEWILKVADVAAELKIGLSEATNRSELVNALRDSDIKFQRVDPDYATRAGSNNVHFLLARPEINTDAKEYLTSCLKKGTELNALGAYSWFHVSALYKASKYSVENLSPEERSALILSALADEAFALHFLEDVFASGHTAGTWGDASQRKGTHDFYNERGLEVVTWDGQRMILMGDANIRPVDAEVAAIPIRKSIEQFLDAVSGKTFFDYKIDEFSSVNEPDSFNVCKNLYMPTRTTDKKLLEPLAHILVKTPVPGLATGLGELPRFRTELGMFIGVSPALRASTIFGGFGTNQKDLGGIGGIEAAIRFGIGLDGVLNEAGDGLVFAEFGWRQDGSSTNQFTDSDILTPAGAITSAIPGRSAYNLRFRFPFWLIPGDLLIAGPILLFVSPEDLTKMAVIAGNGGLIPWQSGIATSIGRFQFVLGREIGIYFYGRKTPTDVLLIPTSSSTAALVEYRSLQLDFPILEYRPFRTFSLDQSSSLMIQITAGLDIPQSGLVLTPEGDPAPELKTTYYIGTRLLFDWRYYFN